MANNRLYIYDTETGERFCLAKSWGGGWEHRGKVELNMKSFGNWLRDKDTDASAGNCKSPTRFIIMTENTADQDVLAAMACPDCGVRNIGFEGRGQGINECIWYYVCLNCGHKFSRKGV